MSDFDKVDKHLDKVDIDLEKLPNIVTMLMMTNVWYTSYQDTTRV